MRRFYFVILISFLIVAGFLFTVSSVSAANCSLSSKQSYFSSAFNPIISFAEKTINGFGFNVALATAPDPDNCGSYDGGDTCSEAGGSPSPVTIYWNAAPITGGGFGATLSSYAITLNQIRKYFPFDVIGSASYSAASPSSNSYTFPVLSNNASYAWSVEAYYFREENRCADGSLPVQQDMGEGGYVEVCADGSSIRPTAIYYSSASLGYANQPNGSFNTKDCALYPLTVTKAGTGSGGVQWVGSDGSINNGFGDAVYTQGTTVTLTATAADGSTFTGWSNKDWPGEGCSDTGTCAVPMTQARNVTATFALNTYALSVAKAGTGVGTVTAPTGNEDGINCGTNCSENYNSNTSVTLTAAYGANSVFAGWAGEGCSGTGTCTILMTQIRNVTATFTAIPTVDIKANSSDGPIQIPYNTAATISWTSNNATSCSVAPGNWTGISGSQSTGNLMSSQNYILTCSGPGGSATDNVRVNVPPPVNYILTVSKAGTGSGLIESSPAGGIYCGSDCSESYVSGTSVTLAATAVSGSTFTGWSGGGCSGAGATCAVTMDAAKGVTATFGLISSGCVSSPSQNLLAGDNAIDFQTPHNYTNNFGCYSNTYTCPAGYNAKAYVKYITESNYDYFYVYNAADNAFTRWSGDSVGFVWKEKLGIANQIKFRFTSDYSVIKWGVDVDKINCYSTAPANQAPVAVATISKDGLTYANSITVTQGVATQIYLSATGSSDPNGWTDINNGVSADPGKCEWNSDLNQGSPTFENAIAHPASVSACNISLGSKTFNDAPGAYTYQILRIIDKAGGISNVATVQVIVQALPSYSLSVSRAGAGFSTITSSPTGINCPGDCLENYTSGTLVTLTATPDDDSTFTGWSLVACPGNGTCAVTMDAAKTVTATFDKKQYLLTVAKAGTGSGTVTSSISGIICGADCSESYTKGVIITLTAFSDPLVSTFTGWSGGGCSGVGVTCAVTMDAAKTVTATFDLIPKPLPTADIKANNSDGPIDVPYNSFVTIGWTSTNATSCSITPGGWTGTFGFRGEYLKSSQNYVLTCDGPGGQATDNVSVNVPFPDFSVNADPVSISATPVQSQVADSTETTVKIIPFNGFESSVTLSASIQPALPSGSALLFDGAEGNAILKKNQYDSGSKFKVRIGAGITQSNDSKIYQWLKGLFAKTVGASSRAEAAGSGQYTIIISGTDGSITRTATVGLNVQVKNPVWIEI